MIDANSWFMSETVSPRVRRVREPRVHDFFSANMFHIQGRDADLVIDFGMGIASLRSFLQLDPERPVIAIATHGHVDHVGSFSEFETRLGHGAEAEGFAGMEDEATLAHLFRALPDAADRPPFAGWTAAEHRLKPAPLTRTVEEGDVIDLGDRAFRVLHLPGHSPGGIGLIEERSGVFFSGDAIYEGGLVDDLPGCDRSAYRATMERLAVLDVSVTHGGHGNALSSRQTHDIALAYIRNLDLR